MESTSSCAPGPAADLSIPHSTLRSRGDSRRLESWPSLHLVATSPRASLHSSCPDTAPTVWPHQLWLLHFRVHGQIAVQFSAHAVMRRRQHDPLDEHAQDLAGLASSHGTSVSPSVSRPTRPTTGTASSLAVHGRSSSPCYAMLRRPTWPPGRSRAPSRTTPRPRSTVSGGSSGPSAAHGSRVTGASARGSTSWRSSALSSDVRRAVRDPKNALENTPNFDRLHGPCNAFLRHPGPEVKVPDKTRDRQPHAARSMFAIDCGPNGFPERATCPPTPAGQRCRATAAPRG